MIRIATPDTADAICATGGLGTGGELNCGVGRTVAVNLKRWQLRSPEFDGPPEEYRALIISHEVGHWLGYDHRGCPGPGEPAPVMTQQIKGRTAASPTPGPTRGEQDGQWPRCLRMLLSTLRCTRSRMSATSLPRLGRASTLPSTAQPST